MKRTRRDFLKESTLFSITSVAGGRALAQGATVITDSPQSTAPALPTPPTTRRGDMIYRKLGKTGEEVSVVGLGGFHIGKQKDEQESIRLIRTAIDRGITFMDNCWDYNNGASEIRMGKALQGGYRQKAFVMSKIDGRTKESAARQIDESLLRLNIDVIDLMQYHEIIRLEDPDRIFAPEGAAEAMMDAKKAGKIRHIGFTGHKDPIVHLRMLDIAKQNGMQMDAVQLPINVMDAHFRSFTNQVLPRLVNEGIAPLAMKTFGDPFILQHVTKSGTAKPIELLHYSMSLPVSVVITGIDSMAILDQAIEAARTFTPMSMAQKTALLDKMRIAAAKGEHEKFKTSARYDGTAKNPQWLG